ncbi:MAG: formyltransferase family protein [Paenacidovorax caeni]
MHASRALPAEVLDARPSTAAKPWRRRAGPQELIDRYDPAPWWCWPEFMRILTPGFVARYAGRLVNIHPSLLPAFTGLHTHQRALEAGCKFAGCTVHLVTAELDVGPILEQAVVPVLEGDTADTLALPYSRRSM